MRTVRQLTIANAAFYVALGVTSPFITIYLQDLGASFAQIAWVMTGFTLSGLISAYLCGRLSDIYRTRRPFVIVGLAISVAANLMMPLAQDTMTAGLLRVADGIGLGAYNALTLAMMGDVLAGNPRRGRIMGLFRGLGSLTFAVGALISGWLADRWASLRLLGLIFLLGGAASLVILAAEKIGYRLPEWPVTAQILFMTAALFFVPSMILGGVSPLVAKLAVRDLARTGTTLGRIYAAGTVGSIVGTFATGFVLISLFGTHLIVWGVAVILLLMAALFLLAGVQRGRAALGMVAGMPEDAGEAIFTAARVAGWLAHAMEEYDERPLRFRPRAIFVGDRAVT